MADATRRNVTISVEPVPGRAAWGRAWLRLLVDLVTAPWGGTSNDLGTYAVRVRDGDRIVYAQRFSSADGADVYAADLRSRLETLAPVGLLADLPSDW